MADQRARLLVEQDRKDEAKQELATLREDLKGRGVNDVVLRDIRKREEAL